MNSISELEARIRYCNQSRNVYCILHLCAQIFPSKLLTLKGILPAKQQLASSFPWLSNIFLYPLCRENELLCTHSASSPLTLMASGFGVEVLSSLHDIEVENDIIKLSGYISGPCNTSNMKVIHIFKCQLSISSYPNFCVDSFSVPSPNFWCVSVFALQALEYVCIHVLYNFR